MLALCVRERERYEKWWLRAGPRATPHHHRRDQLFVIMRGVRQNDALGQRYSKDPSLRKRLSKIIARMLRPSCGGTLRVCVYVCVCKKGAVIIARSRANRRILIYERQVLRALLSVLSRESGREKEQKFNLIPWPFCAKRKVIGQIGYWAFYPSYSPRERGAVQKHAEKNVVLTDNVFI